QHSGSQPAAALNDTATAHRDLDPAIAALAHALRHDGVGVATLGADGGRDLDLHCTALAGRAAGRRAPGALGEDAVRRRAGGGDRAGEIDGHGTAGAAATAAAAPADHGAGADRTGDAAAAAHA